MEDVFDDWLEQVETAAYTPKPGAYFPYHRDPLAPLTALRYDFVSFCKIKFKQRIQIGG